jgi:hypothetical protein
MEVSPLHAPAPLLPGKGPPVTIGCVGTRADPDVVKKRKFVSLPEFEPLPGSVLKEKRISISDYFRRSFRIKIVSQDG